VIFDNISLFQRCSSNSVAKYSVTQRRIQLVARKEASDPVPRTVDWLDQMELVKAIRHPPHVIAGCWCYQQSSTEMRRQI
jgi:hypothetical protein